MKSYVTSYYNMLTQREPNAPEVERIEIPLIQRDYAQGRDGAMVERIRTSFIDVLHSALIGHGRVSLDFVFGDVEDGTLRPLDGQQRLTTLFLLHWYLAFRGEQVSQAVGWKRFSYTTRASARLFCERLVESRPPPTVEKLSAWLIDQSWYLHTWLHDPTVQSMLVMLDALHARFRGDDCLAAWERLVNAREPAISFHLLLLTGQMDLNEDAYIKMNSRGKPLTPFETFKGQFEQLLENSHPERSMEFALKVDDVWSDIFWRYRGIDSSVDEEFLRYFRFVTEVCRWHDGQSAVGDIELLAEEVYGQSNPACASHLDFLFRAFDTWVGVEIPSIFSGLFAAAPAPLGLGDTSKVVLFLQQSSAGVDLFSACCKSYGEARNQNWGFSLPHIILLYAVLLHQMHQSVGFTRRLRILRNLIETSRNELRLERMPALLADVRRIVVDGALEDVSAFNQAQVADEQLKVEFLTRNPGMEQSLLQLEDHPELRGCLAAFDLDARVFDSRASAFHRLFILAQLPSLTGSMLATGDYSRKVNHRTSLFGSGSNFGPWRELLTGAGRTQIAGLRSVLGHLLDSVTQTEGDLQSVLDAIQNYFLDNTVNSDGLEWRWYFVKYPVMREGRSGLYVGVNGVLGYDVCMLDKSRMSSWYRDPYLSAIHRESNVGDAVEDLRFTSYETEPRWMRLKTSGTEMRCVDEGLALRVQPIFAQAEAFTQVCINHGVRADHVLLVSQTERDGRKLDTLDRVKLGAALLRDLVQAGL